MSSAHTNTQKTQNTQKNTLSARSGGVNGTVDTYDAT